MSVPQIYSLSQFSDKHPAFSVSALRQLRFYMKSNGFESAFLTLGRKVLIDEEKFFECLECVNGKGGVR